MKNEKIRNQRRNVANSRTSKQEEKSRDENQWPIRQLRNGENRKKRWVDSTRRGCVYFQWRTMQREKNFRSLPGLYRLFFSFRFAAAAALRSFGHFFFSHFHAQEEAEGQMFENARGWNLFESKVSEKKKDQSFEQMVECWTDWRAERGEKKWRRRKIHLGVLHDVFFSICENE